MCRCTRITVVLTLLAVMVLGTALSGCGGTPAAGQPAAQVPQNAAQPRSTPPAALAKALAAFSGPIETPEAFLGATPAAEVAQTITQEIVIHNSGGEAGITTESTFTVTAQIQVGVVDGIDYTGESVPMPEGALPYDVADLPDIGDAVQQSDGLVVQVTGWRTVDVDDDNQFVLVDLVVGNAGEERQLVATNPCMEIVSGDGHWYSASWYGLHWLGTGGQEYATAMAQDLHDKLLANEITTDFSVALDPGQAAKGTAVFPVPKSAKELAFGFQSYLASTYLFFSNEASPTVFVPLGLEGNFPAVPADVKALAAGTTYKVGQSFSAPKRGVAFQVQSAWSRQQSLGNMFELQPSEQLVVVNVLAPAGAGATPLDQTRELSLVDGSGKAFALQEYAGDWLTLRLGQFNQRGVLVFKGPRAATGLKLKFTPLDPATMAGDAPKPLAGEAVTIDLGQIPVAPQVVVPGATAPGGQATPTGTPGPKSDLGKRVVVGSLAITANKVDLQDGPEGFKAGEGNTWVVAYVTVENVGDRDDEVDPERFDFVEESGVVHDRLSSAASVWVEMRPKVLSYVYITSGGKLQNKALIIRVDKTAVPGLRLRYKANGGKSVLWNLGL